MHDGSQATLADVVAFYRRGGNANAELDRQLEPLELSDREASALVAFLEALSRPAAERAPKAR
jgi:cytochrome c peroxidase